MLLLGSQRLGHHFEFDVLLGLAMGGNPNHVVVHMHHRQSPSVWHVAILGATRNSSSKVLCGAVRVGGKSEAKQAKCSGVIIERSNGSGHQ